MPKIIIRNTPCPPTEITFTFDNNLIAVVDTSPYNIDCSTYLNMAILSDNVGLNGNWIEDGTNLGKPLFRYETDPNGELFYNGTNWQVQLAPFIDIDATAGNEAYPWLATWSGVTIVEGTIENYCGGGVCADATVNVNGNLFDTVASGSTLNIPILNEDGGGIGTITGTDVIISNSDISINGTLVQSVLAEDSQNINVFNSNNENVGVENTGNWEIGDSTVTVNGNAYDTIKAEGTLDIAVEYENGTPVGTINAGVVEIPDNRFNTASITKTGQTTSYATGDDGDLQRGSGVDFLTLSYNNPHGNTSRFSDSAGGQTYANGEAYDWANADYVNRLVPVWYLTPQTAATWANAMANQPYTINSQSWYIPNYQEACSICNLGAVNSPLNYAPFNLATSVSNQGFWTSTTNINDTSIALRINVFTPYNLSSGLGVGNVIKTNTPNSLLIRYESF